MNAIIIALMRAGYNVPAKLQEAKSGWSANLSYKTYQALKNAGVMS